MNGAGGSLAPKTAPRFSILFGLFSPIRTASFSFLSRSQDQTTSHMLFSPLTLPTYEFPGLRPIQLIKIPCSVELVSMRGDCLEMYHRTADLNTDREKEMKTVMEAVNRSPLLRTLDLKSTLKSILRLFIRRELFWAHRLQISVSYFSPIYDESEPSRYLSRSLIKNVVTLAENSINDTCVKLIFENLGRLENLNLKGNS